MASVADDLRADTRRRLARLTPRQRIDLALQLGDDDRRMFQEARGIGPDAARRLFASRKQSGRQDSVVSRRFLP